VGVFVDKKGNDEYSIEGGNGLGLTNSVGIFVDGGKGWGGPLYLKEEGTRKVVASVTGGGIHPVAAKISELLGVPAVDGFNTKVEPEDMIVAVVDCGGTARCGVYPKQPLRSCHGGR
jgi:PTS system glucitol/sorbitol-specific IIC component